MMNKLKVKLVSELSAEDVAYINKLIERDKAVDGLMDDKSSDYRWNRCPKCDRAFLNDGIYCKDCGQKLRFIDYSTKDVLPL